ncbi:putative xylogalacturonan beta-1,3-xylosyltransferase [Lupinus albus]|uniref:Putative xylogalacturonan beta-1,3-xylosyltransferase n=1 Tax=Lupinus albus TaxID=3870 RepID=A0A6A4NC53_LUPAL|nr:putative xylogalacturonan beta-1,3-xylosyltransferase [Lupinus albus]
MDRAFRFLCQAETKRLVSFLGITLAIVLVVQYSELPYTQLLSSLTTKITSFSMDPSLVNSEVEGNNITHPNAFEQIPISPQASHLDQGRKAKGFDDVVVFNNFTTIDVASPMGSVQGKGVNLTALSSLAPQSMVQVFNRTSLDSETDWISPAISVTSNATLVKADTTDPVDKDEKSGSLQGNGKYKTTKNSRKRPSKVVSISEMNLILQRSHASSRLLKSKWSSAIDLEILYAKSEIENAPVIVDDSRLYSPLYRNVSMFKRSYELMEKMLKVYVYQDGNKPIFHEPLLDGIYASEGWFLKLMEANKQFVSGDPGKAHLFYIPFSSRLLQLTLYVRNSHKRSNLIEYMKNHVDMIAGKYPFWNRTNGTDHFVVACHDWFPQ